MHHSDNSVGIVLHAADVATFMATRPALGWIEVQAESVMHEPGMVRALAGLRPDYHLSLHSVGLSLGSAGGLDPDHLCRLVALHAVLEPQLVSDHLSWSTSGGVYLNALLPLPRTNEALEIACRNIDMAQSALGRTILVENVSAYVGYRHDEMSEGIWMAEVTRRTGCRMLCDVNNVFVNCANGGEDPRETLAAWSQVPIGQIHLGGHARVSCGNGWLLLDDHGGPVDPPVWELYAEAVRAVGPKPTLIEWDANDPTLASLLGEAGRAAAGTHATCRRRECPMTLADLQARFAAALLTGDDDAVVALLDQTVRPAHAPLDVYRESMFAGLTATLARAFPQIRSTLGDEAFRQAAHAFIRACPPTSPCLRDYGDRFPDFVDHRDSQH